MLALAFGPMTSLVQLELISASVPNWRSKVGNALKFALLAAASAMMMSCSRYMMQVFTTLVEYSSFLPYRKFTEACNDKSVDAMFRSEEHTSELQSLMRISYAVFCLKKK